MTRVLIPLYRLATTLGLPAISLMLRRRRASGKEDAARAPERRGIATRPRPEGPLLWIHAASVGESLSILTLIARLRELRPGMNILVTTGTVTSAGLMAQRLPRGATHQYVPVDRPAWVRAFLDHWHPDAALFVESELWPNLVLETHRRKIPSALINGRMSTRSFARWRRMQGFIGPILGGFDLVLGQTPEDAERFARLGATNTGCAGNLKYAAGPLPVDELDLARVRKALAGRPLWLASSTHPGEDEQITVAHTSLAARYPDLLTILIPRHPSRGGAIAKLLTGAGLTYARRSEGAPVTSGTAVYLADTMGELGLFYRLAGIVFIGGSLVRHGGQNLLEPAHLDSALLAGPHLFNFAAIEQRMKSADALLQVSGAADLAVEVGKLLADEPARKARAVAAKAVAASEAGVLDACMEQIMPLLERMTPDGKPEGASHAHA